MDEIIQHRFFFTINPKNVLIQKTVAPYKPNYYITKEDPLINFDIIYINQPIENFNKPVNSNYLRKINYLFDIFKK